VLTNECDFTGDLERLAFMNCPLCGEVCHCQSEPLPSASAQRRPDLESRSPLASALGSNALESNWISPEVAELPTADAPAWRNELSARLNRYRARRKVRPPRYPSLSLQFEPHQLSSSSDVRGPSSPPPAFENISNHALALDGLRPDLSAAVEAEVQSRQARAAEAAPQPIQQPAGHSGAKIIEFPRFAWGPPAPPPDQLAEPVSERPRILDVPEVAPPAPALGGITIEADEHSQAEKRPGIDIPLQSAPLGLRFLATLVDGIIIASASALFGFIFWKIVGVRPPLVQSLGLASGIPCVFWAAYQYLLIVYAASTPGLRLAGLELARFNGTHTTRSLRRWRVMASWLSAVSAGMGYAWVFLDEDALCWHDRITHTYLAPVRRESKKEAH
jgi:uncharacterized RDD family membrane protein YckC